MKKALLFIIILLWGTIATAQDKSNKGKEFWLGYGNNVLFDNDFPVNSQNLVLYLSAEEAADVTISINGTSWSQQVHIPANKVDFSVVLPKTGTDDCRIISEGLFTRGIHIVSSTPIVVYAHQYDDRLSGATMLMPVETYGYTYYSINYTQPSWGTPVYSWFFVIASEDNTRLEITPSDSTQGGKPAGETFIVNLNKGELYNVFGKVTNGEGSKDMTGSKVVSVAGADGKCHPVALFSGASRFIVCDGDGGEIMQQQIFPASAWGTRYLTYHIINTGNSNNISAPFLNIYRVAVGDPSTVVKRNGVVLTGLTNNFYYEFRSTSGDYIEADKPIMVAQYTPSQNQCNLVTQSPQGDTEMFILSPIEQGIKRGIIYNTRNFNITANYINLIIHKNGIASLKIDGAAMPASTYITHPNNSDYCVVVKRLLGAAAQHSIESDSAFTAQVYGTGIFESYGYIAGTLVNNLNSIGSIHNTYNSTTLPNTYTCPNSPVQFSIKLAYRASSIQWLCSQVNGISPATDTTIINPVPVDSQIIAGRKYYNYNLPRDHYFADTGTYYIPVIYTAADIDHCSHEEKSSFAVIVKDGPVADFSTNYPGCSKDTAYFTGTPIAGNYNLSDHIWYYEDNTSDSALNSYKIFASGDHSVRFRVIADNGCLDDTTKLISTFMQPIASFSYDRDVCIGDSIRLIDNSAITTGTITQFNWNFGDGNSSTRTNNSPFYHIYSGIGSYDVSLVSISDKGCRSDTFALQVTVKAKPLASFTINGQPCVDSNFIFTPGSVSGSIINSLYFDFGDGQFFSGAVNRPVTHAYLSPSQNITARFALSIGPGCNSDTVISLIEKIAPNPIADFSIPGNSFCAEKDISFTGNNNSDLAAWLWDFGNSTGGSLTPPFDRTYTNAGTYAIKLIVTNTDGCSSKPFIRSLTIHPTPHIDAGPSVYLMEGKTAIINATVNNPTQFSYLWSPGDHLSSTTVLNPITNTTVSTLYTVKATSANGLCEGSDTVNVIVFKQLYIPNAFSPNRDGLNDVWNIPALAGYPNAVVMIYNRWGQQIYYSKGYKNPWDGTLKGQAQPMGAYYYIVQPDANLPEKLSGSVMLVR